MRRKDISGLGARTQIPTCPGAGGYADPADLVLGADRGGEGPGGSEAGEGVVEVASCEVRVPSRSDGGGCRACIYAGRAVAAAGLSDRRADGERRIGQDRAKPDGGAELLRDQKRALADPAQAGMNLPDDLWIQGDGDADSAGRLCLTSGPSARTSAKPTSDAPDPARYERILCARLASANIAAFSSESP